MNRGLYSEFTNNKGYSRSKKEWRINLSTTTMYWYDLLVNTGEVADYFDTRSLIVADLKKKKLEVESLLEKRFIYFICSRTKVRFDPNQKHFYTPFSNSSRIHVLVGRNKKKQVIKPLFIHPKTGQHFKPKIEVSEKYITIHIDEFTKETYSIHDFLANSNTNLGINSNVEYVGYTKNPHTRPTNGSHTGLSDILLNVSNDENDTLLFFNLFKVTTSGIDTSHNIHFHVPNAMTDEIDVDLEGQLIEKSFILYFDSKNQNRHKEQEKIELKNNLDKINVQNNINSLSYYYAFDGESDYWSFSSSSVMGNMEHDFLVKLNGDEVSIKSEDGSMRTF